MGTKNIFVEGPMPKSMEQEASKHRRSIRLDHRDYSFPGIYFVTICAHERRCVFGRITNANLVPSEPGRVVRECWVAIPPAAFCPSHALRVCGHAKPPARAHRHHVRTHTTCRGAAVLTPFRLAIWARRQSLAPSERLCAPSNPSSQGEHMKS